jgi:hypothetical protein
VYNIPRLRHHTMKIMFGCYEESKQSDLFTTILEQNWLHLRHIEDQRMWFTNVYGVIVAGTLAFVSQNAHIALDALRIILGFLLLLSVLGFGQTIKTNAEIGVILDKIHEMCREKGFLDYVDFVKLRQGWRKIISIRRIYAVFYFVMIVFFLCLLFILPTFLQTTGAPSPDLKMCGHISVL